MDCRLHHIACLCCRPEQLSVSRVRYVGDAGMSDIAVLGLHQQGRWRIGRVRRSDLPRVRYGKAGPSVRGTAERVLPHPGVNPDGVTQIGRGCWGLRRT